MNQQNIIIPTLIVILVLILVLFYLHFQNQKECFEGIAGTSFVSRVPKGTIVAYNKAEAPAGWAICNGESGTPDLRGKFILGFNPSNKPDPVRFVNNLFDKGGEERVKLSIDEMPSHKHSFDRDLLGPGNTRAGINWDGRNAGSANETLSEGKSQPHNNMPPYYVLVYIIKL
jgi:microcystin-dependent protein